VQRLAALLRSEELATPSSMHDGTDDDAGVAAKNLQFHIAEKRLKTKADKAESWLQTLQVERQSLRSRERRRTAASATSALTSLGSFQVEHGHPNAAVLGLQRAVKIIKKVVVEDDSDSTTNADSSGSNDDKRSDMIIAAKAEAALADALCAAGGQKGTRQTEAKALFGEALQTLHRAKSQDTSDDDSIKVLSATIHANLAHCLHLNGDLSTAAAMLRVAGVLANEVSASARGPDLIPRLARLLGGVRHDEGSTEEAIRLYEQYLDTMPAPQGSADGPNEYVEVFETLQDIALARSSLGHQAEALHALADVLVLQERLNTELRSRQGRAALLKKEGSPDLALLGSIGRSWQLRAEVFLNDNTVHGDRSRLREAVAASAQAMVILKTLKHDGEGLRQLSDALNTHGNALSEVGRDAEAEGAYRQALDLSRELHGENNPLTAANLHNVGAALARQGQHNKALELLNQALSILRQTLGDNPDVSAALASIASILWKQGEKEKALSKMQEALHIAEKSLPAGHSARIHYEKIVARWEQKEMDRRAHRVTV